MPTLRRRLAVLILPALLALCALVEPARADLAPPDRCNGEVGTACNNAGPSYNGAGVCTATTCSRSTPPTMPGGPAGTTTYPCKFCQPKASADGGSGSDDDGGSCSYGGGALPPGLIAGLAMAAAVFLRRARRRR